MKIKGNHIHEKLRTALAREALGKHELSLLLLHKSASLLIQSHCLSLSYTSPSPPASVGNLRASWVLLSSSISSFCSLI